MDVICYLSHGDQGLGKGHAGCGKKCVQSGLPVAIKVGDKLYLASMADHVGETIEVHGTVMEKDGQRVVAISQIEKAE